MAEWGKIYGSLHGSPKWRRATKPARALWTTALSWCIDQETDDGSVPADLLKLLEGTKSEANCLVSVGLWVENGDGWQFHDWLDYQRSSEQIERDRAADRERKRRSRASAGGMSRRDSTGSHSDQSRRDSTGSPTVEERRVEESRGEVTSASADAEREFDEWYSLYPRKKGKGQAVKAYRTARKTATAEQLLDGLRSQLPALLSKEASFIPYPATWLNGQRWEDVDDSAIRPPARRSIEGLMNR